MLSTRTVNRPEKERKKDAGGSCIILPLSTATEAVFQISGPTRLAFTKNGSFYDIDQGVTPDFVLPTPEQFYNRKALTNYINKIMWKKISNGD